MAKTFSIIGVLSGLPQDRRELIFAKETHTFDDFFKEGVAFSPSNDHAHRQRSHFHHFHHSRYNHYNHSQPNQHFNRTQQLHHSNRGYQPTTSHTDFFHQGSRPSFNRQQRDPLLPHPPHPVTQLLGATLQL